MEHIYPLVPTIAACAATLLIGGLVKGISSIGLPLVGLPLLLLAVDVQTAVGLLVVPVLLSNLLQAIEGKGTMALLRRFSPLLVCLALGTVVGTMLFAVLSQSVLLLTIGGFSLVFATVAFTQPHLTIPPRVERWLAPPVGFAAGVIGGMSTLFGPILATFVIALRLPPATFVKCISLLYVAAGSFMLVSGASQGTTGPFLLTLSTLAMIPVYIGMRIGQRLRERLNPERFRTLVLAIVWLSGANMVRLGLGF